MLFLQIFTVQYSNFFIIINIRSNFRCIQIELTRNYDHSSFFEDLRKMYFNAGVENNDTVFLFTDTQIVKEEFLEDINNILNSGMCKILLDVIDISNDKV